jgi:hypothetical protein
LHQQGHHPQSPRPTYSLPTQLDPHVLDITLSKRCPTSKPQAASTLSSDHNLIAFKILLHPLLTKPRTLYDYKHANWPLFRTTLDLSIPSHPSFLSITDLEHAYTTFETSVRQAAASSMPTHTVKINHLTLPPTVCILLKLMNHYRRRYQRSRLLTHHHLHTLFSQAFSTQLSQQRNTKWTSFLKTLHPQSSTFWRITRYFKTPNPSIPPLSYHGTQIYQTPLKAEIRARQFEQSHHLTLNMGSNTHSLRVIRHVNRFFCSTPSQTPLLKLTNHHEVRGKILSLKPRAAPGDDGIKSVMLRHLSQKALTYLTRLFITSYAVDSSPKPGNEPKSFPSLNPTNHPQILTPTDQSASSA